MLKVFILTSSLLFTSSVFANDKIPENYLIFKNSYVKNYDGDTTTLTFHLPFDITVTKPVRLLDIDTPEISPKKSKVYPTIKFASREHEKSEAIKFKNLLKKLIEDTNIKQHHHHLYSLVETKENDKSKLKVGYYKRILAVLYICKTELFSPYTFQQLNDNDCLNVNKTISDERQRKIP